ncbi:SRPBCC family protein [Luteimonas suaedae]|uniref:SRPBCC family protein n=1 Tax=Luteimonas suaedae TaxID=2605430 RepID=UPI001CA93902|nr:SRPBCC family protein [Luteimonas suaedae]
MNSMTREYQHKAYYSGVLDQSADEAWRMVRDFNDYPRYIEGVTESIIEDRKRGDEVGAVRRFLYGETWLRQRLEAHSDADRSFTYAGMERFPFPVGEDIDVPAAIGYQGTLRLTPIVDGNRTFVEWFVEFDGPSNEAAQWTGLFLELIPQWVDSLRRTLAGQR